MPTFGKLASAMLVCIFVATISLRGDSGDYLYIDLRDATNMGFADEVSGDGRGGWTDQGPSNDMKALPTGRQVWCEVPFDIIDPEENNGTSCIVLRGKPRSAMPLESPAISVGQKGEAIIFAGTCAWSATPDEEVLRMVVTYREDTSYSESAFLYNKHFAAWWRPESLPLGEVAWESFNGAARVGIYCFGWINPYPEKTIEDIKFISANTDAVPIIVAATLLGKSPETQAIVEDIRAREEAVVVGAAATQEAHISLNPKQRIRTIPTALVSVGNGSSTSPAYAGPARVLLGTGHENVSEPSPPALPGRPFFRIQTHAVEPSKARGVWDFTQLDRVIDAAISYGAEPMICLSFPPKWFYGEEATFEEAKRLRKPYDIEAYAEHCAQIVRHYTQEREGPPVLWWEIGNEVELHDWSYAYYIKVYAAVAQRLREVEPRIQLGGPVTAGPNSGWAAELIRAVPEQVDFVSYHQYGYSEPFESPDAYVMGRTANFESSARRYQEVIDELSPHRKLPIVITEANTSWRYHEGTDPRIRSMFGAAWTASVLGRFVTGGGDVFCYFTLNGGFGSIWSDNGQAAVFPAWHTLWIYRKFFTGEMVGATSDASTVEVYASTSEGQIRAILINKNHHAVDVTLSLADTGIGQKKTSVSTLALNAQTYARVRKVDPSVESGVETLELTPSKWDGGQLAYKMEPFEVRVVTFD